uniref:fatty-acid amide hydrolase 1-like n=1 Tax=Halichoerus grypus TaxID=9711 RepID=UPI001658CFD9|nr:fatty-acid amide hydrolase 1-like [Halichoerus grypus]
MQDIRSSPSPSPRIEYAVEHLFVGGLFADGGATLLEKLEGDIVDPCIKTMINTLRLPDPLKCFSAYILKYIEPRASQKLKEIRGMGTPKKLWEHHTAMEEYQQEFIAKWRALDLDVLLTRALTPAFSTGHSSMALGGTRIRGTSCGCAVRCSAVGGGAVSPVHEGGRKRPESLTTKESRQKGSPDSTYHRRKHLGCPGAGPKV